VNVDNARSSIVGLFPKLVRINKISQSSNEIYYYNPEYDYQDYATPNTTQAKLRLLYGSKAHIQIE
jgi:hypothetical protein